VALMELLIAFVAAGATFCLLAYMVRVYAMKPQEARKKTLSPAHNVQVETSGQGVSLLRKDSSAVVSRALSTSAYATRWQFQLDRAGVNLRPSEYFLLRVILALMTVVVISAIGRNTLSFIVSVLIAAAAYMLPAIWVNLKTTRRIRAIEGQLVETITLISNALRAGFAFAQGVDVAAKRAGPPISVELNRMLLDINLGMSTEDALTSMNNRIGSEDLDMVVTAILIQRNSGGNLAEVLESVAETMRDRERIKGEIKTLTSSQRFTGWVLSLWPICIAFLFFLINPGIMSLMWTTQAGVVLLFIWAGLNLLGIIALQKILSIDI
jgi:tight adherence protein B